MGPRSLLSETGLLKDLRPEKENPAQARGKSQVRRMSGQLGDWGNLKAVQPALLGEIRRSRLCRCDGRHKKCDLGWRRSIQWNRLNPAAARRSAAGNTTTLVPTLTRS